MARNRRSRAAAAEGTPLEALPLSWRYVTKDGRPRWEEPDYRRPETDSPVFYPLHANDPALWVVHKTAAGTAEDPAVATILVAVPSGSGEKFAPHEVIGKITIVPLPTERDPTKIVRGLVTPDQESELIDWLAAKRQEYAWFAERYATKAKNIPLEDTSPGRASLEAPGISGAEDEGLLNKSLSVLLTGWGVPESMHRATAMKLERIAREDAKAALRPKWNERGKYAELKDLSAPQFLKRVYADEIATDGSIEKETVRKVDPKLMSSVEVYLSNRKSRRKDLGDADGLKLIAGPTSPLKRSSLG